VWYRGTQQRLKRDSRVSDFSPDEAFALGLDKDDALSAFRERFHIPLGRDGKPLIYFAGNSLGLMPKDARNYVEQELEDWARLGVDGHFQARSPWYPYHENFREKMCRLVGGCPHEVVVMNSLTVNLHLLMVSFYRPTKRRYKILVEGPTFPSDNYAVRSQAACHGFNPDDAVVSISPRDGEQIVRLSDIESLLEDHGDQVALLLIAGVNFFTGQVLDMPRLVSMAHHYGCTIGLDLAHAVGNVPLALHDWDVDFAVWCNYKYMNSGPGAIGGAFVHEKHAMHPEHGRPRLAGWWGNDPQTRFRMHLEPTFEPVPSADSWQVSNPPIFSAAPLRASLDIFDEAGMDRLRAKSERLTGYLQYLIDQTQPEVALAAKKAAPRAGGMSFDSEPEEEAPTRNYEVITPRRPSERGCQLSILVRDNPRGLFKELEESGIKGDFREPNVIRVAPTPLYNTFHEVWRFAQVLAKHR